VTIRVLVVDDHAVVREGLKRILEDAADVVVAAEAGNAPDALELVRRDGFDVVVTDISMPGRGGLELLADLKQEQPRLPVLVLSVHGEDQLAQRALRAGAAGYLTKQTAPEELLRAVRQVAEGRKFVSPRMAERLAEWLDPQAALPAHARLSDREFVVMVRLARGRSVKEIALELSLSVKTVSTYRTRLLDKMGVRSNAELGAYAVQHGLIELP
jgi:DNA-binding NarL/FixJ family response regulator